MVTAKQLGSDEHIELSVRQHVKALFAPILVFLVVCAAAGFLVAIVPSGEAQLWLRLAVLVLALAIVVRGTVWPFLNWLTSTYTVTNERLLTSHGVLRRYGRTMPLSRVNDVSFELGVIDRMLGCGTLVVSSAGETGQLELPDVPHVESVQRTIYQLVEAEADRARSATRSAGDPGQ